eukprot:678025-Pyramimonas_sp.AAC.1
MDRGVVHGVQWCDARDKTADGHAMGRIDRALPLQAMEGHQFFMCDAQKYRPYRGKRDSANMGAPYSGPAGTNEDDYSISRQ